MSNAGRELTVFIEVCTEQFQKAMKAAGEAFKELTRYTKAWAPVVSEMHRARVKAVRTAYRRKKGKRW